MSDCCAFTSSFAGWPSRRRVPSANLPNHKLLIGQLSGSLDALFRLAGKSGHSRRATPYRPAGEGLESKMLLSDVSGWTGGKGGISDSPITPANISGLTEQYADLVDGTIEAEPLVATVNITVGPNPGPQTVAFVATQSDSLYAFNLTTGQLEWHTSFSQPRRIVAPIDPSRNSMAVEIWGYAGH